MSISSAEARVIAGGVVDSAKFSITQDAKAYTNSMLSGLSTGVASANFSTNPMATTDPTNIAWPRFTTYACIAGAGSYVNFPKAGGGSWTLTTGDFDKKAAVLLYTLDHGVTWDKRIVDSTVELGAYLAKAEMAFNTTYTFLDGRRMDAVAANGTHYEDLAFSVAWMVPVSLVKKTTIEKAIGAGGTIYCYNSLGVFVGIVGSMSGTKVTPLFPALTCYISINVSQSAATREADKRAFMVTAEDYVSPLILPAKRGVITFGNEFIHASSVAGQENFLTKSHIGLSPCDNLHSEYRFADGQYVYTDGRISIGASGGAGAAANYSMSMIKIAPGQTSLSYLRRPGSPGVLGAFYDENFNFISPVSGLTGVLSGTIAIPAGAVYFYYNTSGSLVERMYDKRYFSLIYGTTPPAYPLGSARAISINGYPLPGAGYEGGLFLVTGMSINRASYGNTGAIPSQDVTTNYITMAALRRGWAVKNFAIGGSVMAVQIGNETGDPGRNPICRRMWEMAGYTNVRGIYIGGALTNDCIYNWTDMGEFDSTSENHFTGAFHSSISQAKEMYPGVPIYVELPIKRYQSANGFTKPDSTNGRGYSLKDYCDMARRIAEYWGCIIVDLFGEEAVNTHIASNAQYFIADRTHMNRLGHFETEKYVFNRLAVA